MNEEQIESVNCRFLTAPHTYGTKACRHHCEHMVGETAAMVMELLLEAEREGLPFSFRETILSQAVKKTGKTMEELIEYKRRGETFPMEEQKMNPNRSMGDEITGIKEDMIKAASRAYQIGLQTGNGGNLSGRVPGTDTIIIKGSGFSFGECDMDNFVLVNLEGEVLEGGGKPSRELLTHLAVYRLRPDIHGIFHCHSPWSIAYAEDATEIPLLTDHARSKLGPIPVIRVEGHGTEIFAGAVERLLTEKPELGAFVQAKHGIFGLGKNIIHAEHNAELIEETAQIALLVSLRQALLKK